METKQVILIYWYACVVEPDFKAVVAKDAPPEERRHRKEKGTEIKCWYIETHICGYIYIGFESYSYWYSSAKEKGAEIYFDVLKSFIFIDIGNYWNLYWFWLILILILVQICRFPCLVFRRCLNVYQQVCIITSSGHCTAMNIEGEEVSLLLWGIWPLHTVP